MDRLTPPPPSSTHPHPSAAVSPCNRFSEETSITTLHQPTPSHLPWRRSMCAFTPRSAGGTAPCAWSYSAASSQVSHPGLCRAPAHKFIVPLFLQTPELECILHGHTLDFIHLFISLFLYFLKDSLSFKVQMFACFFSSYS